MVYLHHPECDLAEECSEGHEAPSISGAGFDIKGFRAGDGDKPFLIGHKDSDFFLYVDYDYPQKNK